MLPLTVSAETALWTNGLCDAVLAGLAAFTSGRMALSALFHRTAEGVRAATEVRQRAALDNARSTLRNPGVLAAIAFASLFKAAFALGPLF